MDTSRIRESVSAATLAIELDGTDALGYVLRGFGILLIGQLDRYAEAIADVYRAHEMNPNDSLVLVTLAYLEAAVGQPECAIEHGQNILRLNPRGPGTHLTFHMLPFARFGARQYANGVRWYRKQSTTNPA